MVTRTLPVRRHITTAPSHRPRHDACRSRRPAPRRPAVSCRRRDVADDPLDQLVEAHRGIALKLAREAIERVGEPELENAIVFSALRGLRQAAARFEPERGYGFATYAWWRVRGAILDALHHYADRAARRRARCRDRAARRHAEDVLSARPSPTARRGAHGDQGSPEALCIAAQRGRAVRCAVQRLREPYRSLVQRSFFDGESLAELAREHGRSRSWASRKRTEALEQLARQLDAFAE